MSNLEHPRITEVGRLLTEIDRLREENKRLACNFQTMTEQCTLVEADRDRLREALAWMDNLDPALVEAAKEKFALEAEK